MKRHAHYIGFDQAHRLPTNPADSARQDMTAVAFAMSMLMAIAAAVAQLLNPAHVP